MFHLCTSVGNSINYHLILFDLRKLIIELFVIVHMLQTFNIVQKLFVTIHIVQSFDIVKLFMIAHIQCTKVEH